eukprot:45394-Alexandrium_andersonii.AAC.1
MSQVLVDHLRQTPSVALSGCRPGLSAGPGDVARAWGDAGRPRARQLLPRPATAPRQDRARGARGLGTGDAAL